MSLREHTFVDKIEVLATGHLQVRRATAIIDRHGNERARSYHRCSYAPGDDVSHEDVRVQAVAAATWTADVIDEYRAWRAQQTKGPTPHHGDADPHLG